MAVATFDTLKFANTLKEAGVPPQQAEAQARALGEVVQLNFKELVTKDDLAVAVREVKQEITAAEQRSNARSDGGLAEIKLLMSHIRNEQVVIRWMLGVTLAGVLTSIGLLARLLIVLPR
ncbi:MAG: CCDC90 family protein [Gemmataceae bacterium]|nr:CCDC90 family protein [Gemmataceae bacterium]